MRGCHGRRYPHPPRSGPALLVGLLLTTGLPTALTVGAQSVNVRRVTVMPFLSADGDSQSASDFYQGFMGGIRTGNWLQLQPGHTTAVGQDEYELRTALRSVGGFRSLSEATGSAFVIGGVYTRGPEGGIEVTSVIFSQDEGSFLALEQVHYPDAPTARAGAVGLASRLSHPSNFTTPDVAFFYSALIPGAGQVSMKEWGWAAISAALVGGTAWYRLSLPSGDPFLYDPAVFTSERDPVTRISNYYISGVEVTQEVWDQKKKEAQAHHSSAQLDRINAVAKKKEANLILLSAYLFNVVNTLILGRHQIDSVPFFRLVSELEAVPEGISPRVGFRLSIPIRR